MLMAILQLASDLPKPPSLEHWFLEQPWPAAMVLGLLGAVAFYSLNQQGRFRTGVAAAFGFVAAGITVVAVATVVTTNRERLSGLTERFIGRVVAADAPSVESLLSEALVISTSGAIIEGFDREDLLLIVKGARSFEIKEWDLRIRGATTDGPHGGRTLFTIRVRSSFTGEALMPSSWELGWRRHADGSWRIVRLECLTIWGQSPPPDWPRKAMGLVTIVKGPGLPRTNF